MNITQIYVKVVLISKTHSLYNSFPRRYGKSKNIIYNKEEFISLVNRDNGFCDVFLSIYSYERLKQHKNEYRVDSTSAVVDKIFIDIDLKDYIDYTDIYKDNKIDEYDKKTKDTIIKTHNKMHEKEAIEKMYFDVRKMEKILRKDDILRIWAFSGGGFHLYIYIKNKPDKNKKQFCKNASNYISNLIYKGNETYTNIDGKTITRRIYDPHCPPKLSQQARVIGTYNPRRKLFCTSLVEEDFDLKYEKIVEKSKKQSNKVNYLGCKLMELPKDVEEQSTYESCSISIDVMSSLKEIPQEITKLLFEFGILWKEVPNCMKYLLRPEQKLNYTERYLLITFLNRTGLTKEEIIEVLKIVLTDDRLYHCCGVIKNNYKPKNGEKSRIETQIEDIIETDYYISCGQIRDSGYCHKNCLFRSVLEHF